METFHILHLAACWDPDAQEEKAQAPPVGHVAVAPTIPPPAAPSTQTAVPDVHASASGGGALQPPARIRAAAAQMVFASRLSQDWIAPQTVAAIEAWTGRALLEALAALEIPPEVSVRVLWLVGRALTCGCGASLQRLHEESGSVWEIKARDAVQR